MNTAARATMRISHHLRISMSFSKNTPLHGFKRKGHSLGVAENTLPSRLKCH